MLKPIELRNLAVMFRVNDPNLGHTSVLDRMELAGLAYAYGLFRAIPLRHRRKRNEQALLLAARLERKAFELEITGRWVTLTGFDDERDGKLVRIEEVRGDTAIVDAPDYRGNVPLERLKLSA